MHPPILGRSCVDISNTIWWIPRFWYHHSSSPDPYCFPRVGYSIRCVTDADCERIQMKRDSERYWFSDRVVLTNTRSRKRSLVRSWYLWMIVELFSQNASHRRPGGRVTLSTTRMLSEV